jgi:hypothetical protein
MPFDSFAVERKARREDDTPGALGIGDLECAAGKGISKIRFVSMFFMTYVWREDAFKCTDKLIFLDNLANFCSLPTGLQWIR